MDQIADFERSYQQYNGICHERAIDQRRALHVMRDEYGDLYEMDAQKFRDWVESIYITGIKPSTVAHQMGLVKPFFSWAWERGHITGDQLMGIRAVKPPRGAGRGQPKPYSRKEIDLFWKQMHQKYPYPRHTNMSGEEQIAYYMRRYERGTTNHFVKGLRKSVRHSQYFDMVSFALYAGLRLGEIVRLKPEDVNPENDYIVVHGAAKNKQGQIRIRAVPWIPVLRERTAHWLWVRERIEAPDDYLWISAWSKTWFLNKASWRNQTMMMHDLGDGWSWHRLRHTYATEALRAGMNLEVLSRILGHSTLQQTMGYAQLVRSDLVEASAKIEDKLQSALS